MQQLSVAVQDELQPKEVSDGVAAGSCEGVGRSTAVDSAVAALMLIFLKKNPSFVVEEMETWKCFMQSTDHDTKQQISLAIHNLAEAYICASLILYPPMPAASKSAQT